ncbi:MAG TPA: CBS domain-containing protein [Oligoflexia bacterium]|nr:CBS domain-containing protein [Oligoflexia bacterium]
MQVIDVMTEDPVCCTPSSKIGDAARLMADNDCGVLPVVESLESRRLVGVITDRDICCRVAAEGKDAERMTVREAMSTPVVTMSPDADLDRCCKVMEENQIRRVPVVDRNHMCCGIVSQADIARETGMNISGMLKHISEPTGMSLRHSMR